MLLFATFQILMLQKATYLSTCLEQTAYMDYRTEADKYLNSLKNKGYSRSRIELELGYSENYITQQLSKGANKKFVRSLKGLLDKILQKATNSEVDGIVLKEDEVLLIEAKNKKPKDDRDVALQALADIAESNKNNSVGISNTSEAIKIMAKTNEELVIMLKSKMLPSEFQKNTMEATVATVAGLREYMIEIAASVKHQSREAAEQEFYKKVGEQMDKT